MTEPPELKTTHWFNTNEALTLNSLRGRVVMIEAFQMLCPGCVSRGLPQAQRVAAAFKPEDIAVIGLHTVFEHHQAQGTKEVLAAFLHEYRITFPVAIDAPSESGGLPQTMAAYGMQGTPTLLLFDREGALRVHKFGVEEDLQLGAQIMSLIQERPVNSDTRTESGARNEPGKLDEGCDDNGCRI